MQILFEKKAAEEVHADVGMIYNLLKASTQGARDTAMNDIRANMPIWVKRHGRILDKYNELGGNEADRAYKFIKTRAVANSALMKLANVFAQKV
uniref:Uncharacterized protein n=1 Tax=Panagrolaimus davidi TaxID=227884 RepID=A0A914Q5Z5_9BILA